MVFSYWTSALSRSASRQPHVGFEPAGGEDRLRDLRHEAPGAVRPAENRLDSCVLWPPRNPLRLIAGNRPPWPRRCWRWRRSASCSAARISGRRSSSADGKPGGHFRRHLLFHELAPARQCRPGFLPSSRLIWFSVCSICCCSAGIVSAPRCSPVARPGADPAAWPRRRPAAPAPGAAIRGAWPACAARSPVRSPVAAG